MGGAMRASLASKMPADDLLMDIPLRSALKASGLNIDSLGERAAHQQKEDLAN